MNIKTLYEQDFHSWIQHHITLLKESKFSDIDTENLIEELEGMGKRDKREFVSCFIILIAHCLKAYRAEAITKAYPDAVDLAAEETELPLSLFPASCPYTEQQLLTKFYLAI